MTKEARNPNSEGSPTEYMSCHSVFGFLSSFVHSSFVILDADFRQPGCAELTFLQKTGHVSSWARWRCVRPSAAQGRQRDENEAEEVEGPIEPPSFTMV